MNELYRCERVFIIRLGALEIKKSSEIELSEPKKTDGVSISLMRIEKRSFSSLKTSVYVSPGQMNLIGGV